MQTKPMTPEEITARLSMMGRKLAAMNEWAAQKGWGPERKTLEEIMSAHGIPPEDSAPTPKREPAAATLPQLDPIIRAGIFRGLKSTHRPDKGAQISVCFRSRDELLEVLCQMALGASPLYKEDHKEPAPSAQTAIPVTLSDEKLKAILRASAGSISLSFAQQIITDLLETRRKLSELAAKIPFR